MLKHLLRNIKYFLGIALSELGRIEDTIIVYSMAIKINIHHAEAYNNRCKKRLISNIF